MAAAEGRCFTIYATLLGEPGRSVRNVDLAQLLAWGLAEYRVVPLVSAGRVYATARVPWGKKALGLVAARESVHVARVGKPMTERVVTPVVVSLPVRAGQRLGEVRVFDRGKLLARVPLVARSEERRVGKECRCRR